MPSVSQGSERRKHERLKVKNLAIAVPNNPASHVARIVNISKGGMAVRYLDQSDWLENADAIDILVNGDFFMTGIPIKNIFDFKVKDHVSFSIIIERQCCLQFNSLSPEQESRLNEFILTYGAGTS